MWYQQSLSQLFFKLVGTYCLSGFWWHKLGHAVIGTFIFSLTYLCAHTHTHTHTHTHIQSMEELMEKTVPEDIRLNRPLKLDPPLCKWTLTQSQSCQSGHVSSCHFYRRLPCCFVHVHCSLAVVSIQLLWHIIVSRVSHIPMSAGVLVVGLCRLSSGSIG